MARYGDEGHDGHSEDGDRAAEIEKKKVATGDFHVFVLCSEGDIADDQQDANFGWSKKAVRNVELTERIGGEEAFYRQNVKAEQHGDGDGPMHETRQPETGDEGERAEDVDDVVNVKAVARALLIADPGKGAIEGVAEPVECDQ